VLLVASASATAALKPVLAGVPEQAPGYDIHRLPRFGTLRNEKGPAARAGP